LAYRDLYPFLESSSLMTSSSLGGNTLAGTMVEVAHLGVQAQEFLSAFSPSESLLTSWAERARHLAQNAPSSGAGR
jgi:hypothetical protein